MPASTLLPSRGADPPGAQHALDAGLAHQPGSLIPADLDPRPAGRLPQLPRPIDLEVVLPQLGQPRRQLLIAAGTRRERPLPRGVVAARSHLQHPADGLDPEPATLHHILL